MTDPLFGRGLRTAQERHRDSAAEEKGTTRQALRRLPTLFTLVAALGWRADRPALLAVLACQLASGAAAAAAFLTAQHVLAGIFSVADGTPVEQLTRLLPAAALLLAALAARALLQAVVTTCSGRLGPRITRAATMGLLRRAAGVELATLEDPAFHDLLASGKRGAEATRRVTEQMVGLCGGLVSIGAALLALLVLDPRLVPLLLLTLIPSCWGAARVAGSRHASATRWIELTRQLDTVSQLLVGRATAEEIRAHRAGSFLLGEYGRLSSLSEREQARLARAEARTRIVSGAASGLAAVATYGVLVALMVTGQTSVAVAGAAAFALRSASGSLVALVLQFGQLYEDGLLMVDWRTACARADEAAITRRGRAPRSSTAPPAPSTISAHGLRFRYPGAARPAVDGLDIVLRRGEVVALVGENGSGKSTVAKLLAGLYLPSDGTVRWDGVPTTELDRGRLAEHLAVVAQDVVRWPFTAKVNTTIGVAELDDGRLSGAAARAGADRVVAGLPDGWDTLLAREFWSGTALSGGQWQRIGLARAFYRDAPVLIVDEPTAALDPAAEVEIGAGITDLARSGHAVLVITHRLAAAARADRIHVLDAGRVVQSGTHAELVAVDGPYRRLYRLQAEQYDLTPTGSAET
ncbi:ATP-binding cassette domain-containing protein [Pseudonocardia sp. TRM90224]|uniref:ATP-binding cassette domain-containing protein n=1 Tax=Pseudonocardia sp. TRM90224 TaxID=2812678 RepID=UPI001E6206B3|nr:ABC transporter ATP-binding protein [Pseudonocardia sp. TRM90224]